MENCDLITGRIKEVNKSYGTGGKGQDGWIIKLEEVDYKIRIVGEYYNAMNHENFAKYIKPGVPVDVYFLKPVYHGIGEYVNDQLGFKDATAIVSCNKEILEIESIKERLSHLFVLNLIVGLIVLGFGLKAIFESLKQPITESSLK